MPFEIPRIWYSPRKESEPETWPETHHEESEDIHVPVNTPDHHSSSSDDDLSFFLCSYWGFLGLICVSLIMYGLVTWMVKRGISYFKKKLNNDSTEEMQEPKFLDGDDQGALIHCAVDVDIVPPSNGESAHNPQPSDALEESKTEKILISTNSEFLKVPLQPI